MNSTELSLFGKLGLSLGPKNVVAAVLSVPYGKQNFIAPDKSLFMFLPFHTNVYKYLMRWNREHEATHFSDTQ